MSSVVICLVWLFLQESCFHSYILTENGTMEHDRGCDDPEGFISCLALIGQEGSDAHFAQGWTAPIFDVPV